MSDNFDAYHKWFGIHSKDQPPDHYRLLGVELFESDPDVIQHAADQRMAHLKCLQAGPHGDATQKLLNEVALAKTCLLNPSKKSSYDLALREMIAERQVVAANSSHPTDTDATGVSPARSSQRSFVLAGALAVALMALILFRPKQSMESVVEVPRPGPVTKNESQNAQHESVGLGEPVAESDPEHSEETEAIALELPDPVHRPRLVESTLIESQRLWASAKEQFDRRVAGRSDAVLENLATLERKARESGVLEAVTRIKTERTDFEKTDKYPPSLDRREYDRELLDAQVELRQSANEVIAMLLKDHEDEDAQKLADDLQSILKDAKLPALATKADGPSTVLSSGGASKVDAANPARDQPGGAVKDRSSWFDSTYDATVRQVDDRRWVQTYNKTGRIVELEEKDRTSEYIELYCPTKGHLTRISSQKTVLNVNGKWEWAGYGYWLSTANDPIHPEPSAAPSANGSRSRWVNKTYSTTFQQLNDGLWEERAQGGGPAVQFREVARLKDYVEMFNLKHRHLVRLTSTKMEEKVDGNWIWSGNGNWEN